MLYALLVAVVTGLFSANVIRDYLAKRKMYHGLWSAALVMSCIAALCYAVAAVSGSAIAFKIYYLFGALLVAPYTGMGSLFLVMQARLARRILWGVHVVSLAGLVLLLTAGVDAEALANLSGSSGRGVLEPGAWLVATVILNFFGAITVVGVAFYSVLRAWRNRSEVGLMVGNALIGAGFLLLAVAGSVARWWPTWDGGFWVTMALGWVIAYFGFRKVTAAVQSRSVAPTARAEQKGA